MNAVANSRVVRRESDSANTTVFFNYSSSSWSLFNTYSFIPTTTSKPSGSLSLMKVLQKHAFSNDLISSKHRKDHCSLRLEHITYIQHGRTLQGLAWITIALYDALTTMQPMIYMHLSVSTLAIRFDHHGETCDAVLSTAVCSVAARWSVFLERLECCMIPEWPNSCNLPPTLTADQIFP